MFLFSSCFGKLISSICFPWAVWCVSRLLRFFGVLVNYPKHCVSQFPPEINPETELVEVVPNTASTGAQEQWLLLCPPAFFSLATSACYALCRQKAVDCQLYNIVFFK